MKNLVSFLVVMGLANLGFAQNSDIASAESPNLISSTSVKSSRNSDYLTKINDRYNSDDLLILEKKVSEYDVTRSTNFDGRTKTFTVKFVATKGAIEAIYDENGIILSTTEKFKDVNLPVPVRHTAFNLYPDWQISGNVYSVNYYRNKDAEKTYKLKLTKGKKKTVLYLDSEGNQM